MAEVLSILHKIGFDGTTAVVSIVNFFIVYAILAKYLFPGLQRKIEERENKINEINKKEKLIEIHAENKKKEADKLVEEAHLRADQIISNAIANAEIQKRKVASEAKDEVLKIQKQHAQELVQQKNKMVAAAHKEIVDLAVKVSERILNEKITDEVNTRLIEDLVTNVETKSDVYE